jgi:DNA-directed RNA polymerase subunit M/transcription elongation factor TFIIS
MTGTAKILFLRNIFSGISFPLMESVDQQWQQLKKRYEQMTEGELAALAEEAYDLTEIAREALQNVITEKGLDLRLKLHPLASVTAEGEDLVVFCRPGSYEEIRRIKKILSADGILCFICMEVRGDDLKRAEAAYRRAIDEEFEAEDDDPEEKKQFAILCPKCHSAKVVLEGREPDTKEPQLAAKFEWRCEACGHQWKDKGLVQEVTGGQSWPGEEFLSRDDKAAEELDPNDHGVP